MKYTEILEMLKLEGAKPLPVWETFTGDGWYKNNGYVAIPDTLPFDYLDKHYRILDLTPIHSMTYEGYAWMTGIGEIHKSRFDMHPWAAPITDEEEQKAFQEIKEKYVTRILGLTMTISSLLPIPVYRVLSISSNSYRAMMPQIKPSKTAK